MAVVMPSAARAHRQLAGIEKHWQHQAHRDYLYNLGRANHFCKLHDFPRCRFYQEEAKENLLWVHKRGKIIAREERLGRRR